ncbi:HesB/YadR/YfhF family protein [Sediminibacillus massiliensis]|uniref:HesB/YadR/YfhF family protein n=1 Tax=Sediminibacillus massiliensis TaxID=1926277 RepID=UPI0009886B65|nr:HesB/YadR/YfhF family protein [Sediminibacillus massiliensis]
MKFSITKPAAQWYINEMDLTNGDYVRFFARYGGHGDIHRGFSLAVSLDEPNDPAFQAEVLGVTFFVEQSDAWYFNDYDFHIKYKRKYDEIEYVFEKRDTAE